MMGFFQAEPSDVGRRLNDSAGITHSRPNESGKFYRVSFRDGHITFQSLNSTTTIVQTLLMNYHMNHRQGPISV